MTAGNDNIGPQPQDFGAGLLSLAGQWDDPLAYFMGWDTDPPFNPLALSTSNDSLSGSELVVAIDENYFGPAHGVRGAVVANLPGTSGLDSEGGTYFCK